MGVCHEKIVMFLIQECLSTFPTNMYNSILHIMNKSTTSTPN